MAKGDHIYVRCKWYGVPYRHHGIDMGDGTVVHLGPEKGQRISIRDDGRRFKVRRDSLEDFAGGRKLEVYAHASTLEPDQIVATAESFIGKPGYDLMSNNCEHFATRCVTGVARSAQIEIGVATFSSLGSAISKLGGAAGSSVGTKLLVRGTTKAHPAAVLADGVEMAILSVGCQRGLDTDRVKSYARMSGTIAAAGIGAFVGGPVGALLGASSHAASTATADRIGRVIQGKFQRVPESEPEPTDRPGLSPPAERVSTEANNAEANTLQANNAEAETIEGGIVANRD